MLERQARYAEAHSLYSKCIALQRHHPELDQSTTGRTHLFLGWLDYRQGHYDQARERFGTALEVARGKRDDWLLGNVCNSLGLLERRAKVFDEALARFRAALDYWCRADYPYGVAAVYANIGNTFLSWGNQFRDARLPLEARTRYRRAVEWLARCLAFDTGARLGGDTSEAMASALWLRGNGQEATKLAEEAAQGFEQLGHPARAAKVRESPEKKALFFPSETR